jgi:hypothetical protein
VKIRFNGAGGNIGAGKQRPDLFVAMAAEGLFPAAYMHHGLCNASPPGANFWEFFSPRVRNRGPAAYRMVKGECSGALWKLCGVKASSNIEREVFDATFHDYGGCSWCGPGLSGGGHGLNLVGLRVWFNG